MNSIARNVALAREFSSREYREAMRALPGGVSILTAGYGSEISGMTVTSLSSLSAEPPRIMVGVNRSASVFPLIQRFGLFGVSILAADQEDVATRFSTKAVTGALRFEGVRHHAVASGVPLLTDATTVIDCQVEEIIERHSHPIVIGRVLDVATVGGRGGTAYRQGKFAQLTEKQENLESVATWALW